MLFSLRETGREFGGKWLFRGVSGQCNVGDRIGLIGRNGVGKTTLLDLIEGLQEPDEGTVQHPAVVVRMKQLPDFKPGHTVLQEVLTVFEGVRGIQKRIRQLERRIAEEGAVDSELSAEYELLTLQLDHQGGYSYEARARKILHGVGLSDVSESIACERLSGGQQRRLLLAKALLEPAELVLLDEPTNHLDLRGILWLTEFLRQRAGPLIAVSHDREFLDQITNCTWELEQGCLWRYPAAYTRSRELRRLRLHRARSEYQAEQRWRRSTEEFVRRNIVGQKTRQAQSRRRQLEKTEWKQRPVEDAEAVMSRLRLPEARRGGAISFELSGAVVGFADRTLIRVNSWRVLRGDRIGILGPNGSGKSTLLRTLIGEIPSRAGQIEWGANNTPFYFAQEAEFDSTLETVYDYLAALNPNWTELELRNFAGSLLFRGEDAFKQIGHLSGGERSRLALAPLFQRPSNVLLLDEPTNHLDIATRETLEEALKKFEGTIVVVSHDLYFLRQVVDEIFLIQHGRFTPLARLDDLASVLQTAQRQNEKKTLRPPSPNGEQKGLSKNEIARRRILLQEIEGRIAALEEAKGRLEQRLNTGVGDHRQLHTSAQELAGTAEQLESLYRQWEQLAEEIAGQFAEGS